MDEARDGAFERHHRAGRPLSLVVIDIEEFSDVNERHGHLGGDELLRDVADALRRGAGAGAHLARHGADEFCVLLPGDDAASADKIAARLRGVIGELRGPGGEPVRAAIGRATVPDDACERDALLQVAGDRAAAPARGLRAYAAGAGAAAAGAALGLPAAAALDSGTA